MRFARTADDFEHNKTHYVESIYQSNLSPEFRTLAHKAREESRKLNKEGISLSLSEAYLISEQVKQFQCISFIELGSLTGYSALFLLRGLQTKGVLYCFEKDDHCADFLEELFSNINDAPELQGKKVHVMRGDALESLKNWTTPMDFSGAFIDANKAAYLEYLNWIEANLKNNYLVIADNVFLSGAVWGVEETNFSKKQTATMIEFNKKLLNDPNYASYFIGTSEGLLVAKRR